MLQTPSVIYCAVDSLVPPRGKIQSGFDDFSAALDHANVPIIWVTDRTRLQIDEPRRKLGHQHPFIAEGGCGVYLPEGYFHLRPSKAVRMGRFTCIPIAEPQPAASEALADLAADAGVAVVPLRSLSPRELAQNSGLPAREAELVRQRDFDEVFFFAGASDEDITRFLAQGRDRKLLFRRRGALWSLAIGSSFKACLHELGQLYERALRSRPVFVGMATSADDFSELFAASSRNILLAPGEQDLANSPAGGFKARRISLESPEDWDQILKLVTTRS